MTTKIENLKGISDWVKKRELQNKRKESTTVAFLAMKTEVSELLEHGYTVKTIWEYLKDEGHFDCCYETFRSHVITQGLKAKKSRGGKPPKKDEAKPSATATTNRFNQPLGFFHGEPDPDKLL